MCRWPTQTEADLKLVDSSDQGEHDGKRGDLKGASAAAGEFSVHASSVSGAADRLFLWRSTDFSGGGSGDAN
jgi:hypothetical protein